jgi:hypothetical protein
VAMAGSSTSDLVKQQGCRRPVEAKAAFWAAGERQLP